MGDAGRGDPAGRRRRRPALRLVLTAGGLVLAGVALAVAAVVVVARHVTHPPSLVTPASIGAEHRLATSTLVPGLAAAVDTAGRAANVQSVVAGAYSADGTQVSHLVVAESGITDDATASVEDQDAHRLAGVLAGAHADEASRRVTAVEGATVTCYVVVAGPAPGAVCSWVDGTTAGVVLAVGDPSLDGAAAFTAGARRAVLG